MSIWLGFAKAQGVGKKVALVKTLVEADDISATVYAGANGTLATISELAKVDFAVLELVSTAGVFNASGHAFLHPAVISYSGNRFLFVLNTSEMSGENVHGNFGPAAISGDNMSGVIRVRALIVGEPKQSPVVN